MPASKIRRSGRSGLKALLGLIVVALTLVEAMPSSHGRSRSTRKHPEPPPAAAPETPAPAAEARVNAAFLYVKGVGILHARLDGSSEASKSEALPATGINDIAIDATGRVWVATVATLITLDASGRTFQQWKPAAVDGQPGEIERVVIAGAGPKQLPDR